MRISLNVEKSIQRECVVNDRQDFEVKFNKCLNILFKVVFVGGVLLLFPLYFWFVIRLDPRTTDNTIIIPALLLPWGLIGLYGSLLGNKFIRLKGGQNLTQNRDIILELLKVNYPKNNFYKGENFMTSYLKPKGFMKCKKPTNRILVLFDRSDILINIAVFSDVGIQSPFHTIFHHWIINRIKNRLREFINNRP